MRIMMVCKYPPIQGGVSADCYWTAQLLAEMGHDIHVLTNAEEVESAYRITMSDSDRRRLTGYQKPGMVKVTTTLLDKRHVFIPQNNPSVSKLISLGLEIIEAERPELIWSHYLEPYGVVAMVLSRITGVPYAFRHAGSDIGRLMLTEQLKSLYYEVLRSASVVMTQPHHHGRLTRAGVREHRFVRPMFTRLRSDLFFPTPINVKSPMILGIYGKVGESKGTGALLKAVGLMVSRGQGITIRAHWGGRDLPQYLSQIEKLGIGHSVYAKCLISHWNIPDFIRSCDAILFLENRFRITFHHPSVPLEAVSCGRPIITTEEVAEKPGYKNLLIDGENSFIIRGRVTAESIAHSIISVQNCLEERGEFSLPAILPETDMPMRVRMANLIDAMSQRL